MSDISWTNEARSARTEVVNSYKASVSDIATALSRADGSGRVLSKHVQQAAQTLDAYGHTRTPWYERYELEVGLGALLFGWASSVDEFLSLFIPATATYKAGLEYGLIGALMLIGASLAAHGWFRGRGINAIKLSSAKPPSNGARLSPPVAAADGDQPAIIEPE